MMNIKHRLIASGALLCSSMLLPSLAQARLDACGGVYLSSDAQCEFVRDKDCETHCETTSVETACVVAASELRERVHGQRRDVVHRNLHT